MATKKNGNGGHKPTVEELLEVLIDETRSGFKHMRSELRELRTGVSAVNGRLDNLIATAGASDRTLATRIDRLEDRLARLESQDPRRRAR